jgi:hypothetical protein
METITSLATTYEYLDEDLVDAMSTQSRKNLQDQLGQMMVLWPAVKAKSYARSLHPLPIDNYHPPGFRFWVK